MRAFRAEQRVLAALIAREQPIAICCTYPAYAFLLAALRKTGRCDVPLFNVVTDSISIHSLWWRAGAAGWFLANEDSADVLRRVGIDEQRLHVLGFPVPPFFAAHSSEFAPAELQRGATPRVLCIINSGTRNAAETARTLLTNTPWEVTCTVGRNDALREELQRLAINRTPRADVLGWTNEMPRLLMTHHVVVSKAGGATTQEAIAARCPMLVNQIVPGQEEGNYELLRRHDIGALTETPEAVVRELHRAFEDRGRVWHAWRAALEPLSRPQAARDIAQRVLELAAQPSAPVTNFPRGSDVVSAPRDERASACPRYGDAPVS
jgi:processive 1,2-diacylglycerol beta-glucosyltransferase